jgi:hypothetical protein
MTTNLPKNIPKLDIQSMPQEVEQTEMADQATIQKPDSNLNKAFAISLKSLEDPSQVPKKFSMENFDFNLNLEDVNRYNFNDEFMKNFKDFSPSWRKSCFQLKDFEEK